jgi:hypothetical protein
MLGFRMKKREMPSFYKGGDSSRSLLRADFGDGLAQHDTHFLHVLGHFVRVLRSINHGILERFELSVKMSKLRLDCGPIGWTVVSAGHIQVSIAVFDDLQALKH